MVARFNLLRALVEDALNNGSLSFIRMYKLAYRQNKLLLGYHRIFSSLARPRFKVSNIINRERFVGNNVFVVSRHYADKSGNIVTRFAVRTAKRVAWTAGFVVITGGIFIMVRCALIRNIIYH